MARVVARRDVAASLTMALSIIDMGSLDRRWGLFHTVGATDALHLDSFLHIHNGCEFAHLDYRMQLFFVSHNNRLCNRIALPSLNQLALQRLSLHCHDCAHQEAMHCLCNRHGSEFCV